MSVGKRNAPLSTDLRRSAPAPYLYRLFLVVIISAVGAPSPLRGQVEEIHKACAKLSAPRHSPDFEPLPRYAIEVQDYDASKPPALDLRISVPTEAFSGTAMTRLACKLAADFPREHAIHALIFDDKKAARRLALLCEDQRHHGAYLWHLRARYELDRDKKLQFIEFLFPEVQDGLLNLRRVKIWISGD